MQNILYLSMKPVTVQDRYRDKTQDTSNKIKTEMKMESPESNDVSPNTVYECKVISTKRLLIILNTCIFIIKDAGRMTFLH